MYMDTRRCVACCHASVCPPPRQARLTCNSTFFCSAMPPVLPCSRLKILTVWEDSLGRRKGQDSRKPRLIADHGKRSQSTRFMFFRSLCRSGPFSYHTTRPRAFLPEYHYHFYYFLASFGTTSKSLLRFRSLKQQFPKQFPQSFPK